MEIANKYDFFLQMVTKTISDQYSATRPVLVRH